MPFFRKRTAEMTFSERFVHIALFWGLPMIALELIGISWKAWGIILILAVPATLLGVLVFTAIEHCFYSSGRRPHDNGAA